MRIIAGKARGLRLMAPKDLQVRPTSDRVKESIFNIIQNSLYDSIVIDLFAGTGNLGIEALSRNAQKAYFVEQSKTNIEIIKENLNKTRFTEIGEVINGDVIFSIHKLALKGVQGDIIFMDPPYNQGWPIKVLEEIYKKQIVTSSGIIIVEHDKNENLLDEVHGLFRFRKKDYGNTTMSFYKLREEI
ncbi:16S rRNA (guanine(966)-N(2))-methyltransferase RsmD [Natronincola ferrireducens]|uniref:16S rRNA (Guanine(966)-N(2))-methyltransferase RsmD n=1 Tax=Natronincola ferrireducens TaxID=393762 RepID=A0A1G9BVR3_9FIRM|nr:16S rRNA (guanine(966)-N(2))-methyltransferase RsmD [Natronincola ferrireducens]SDK43463.1 16S rRNA (guanine(966)-N(2))-methyltransferase RsmD [Natronincola ferrireducens]